MNLQGYDRCIFVRNHIYQREPVLMTVWLITDYTRKHPPKASNKALSFWMECILCLSRVVFGSHMLCTLKTDVFLSKDQHPRDQSRISQQESADSCQPISLGRLSWWSNILNILICTDDYGTSADDYMYTH